jgi:hypothetical protein
MSDDQSTKIRVLVLMLPQDFMEYRPQTEAEIEAYGRAVEARREYREWCVGNGVAPEQPESLERYEEMRDGQ